MWDQEIVALKLKMLVKCGYFYKKILRKRNVCVSGRRKREKWVWGGEGGRHYGWFSTLSALPKLHTFFNFFYWVFQTSLALYVPWNCQQSRESMTTVADWVSGGLRGLYSLSSNPGRKSERMVRIMKLVSSLCNQMMSTTGQTVVQTACAWSTLAHRDKLCFVN